MKTSAELYNKSMQDLFINDDQLAALKRVNCEMLSVLHKICVENGLKYSLAFGTLLGAVRHAGYIPWDDDIDVIMLRADYDKFCEVVSKKYDDEYWMRNRHTDKYCPLYFGKFMKKGTILTECQTESIPKKYGVYIDIFVLDYIPQGELTRKIRKAVYLLSNRMASLQCDFRFSSKTITERSKKDKDLRKYYSMRRLMGLFASLLPLKFWTWLSERAIIVKKPSNLLWTGISLKSISTEEMNRLVLYKFENFDFFGIAGCDEYLRKIYGANYMELPPLEKRERHMIIELEL